MQSQKMISLLFFLSFVLLFPTTSLKAAPRGALQTRPNPQVRQVERRYINLDHCTDIQNPGNYRLTQDIIVEPRYLLPSVNENNEFTELHCFSMMRSGTYELDCQNHSIRQVPYLENDNEIYEEARERGVDPTNWNAFRVGSLPRQVKIKNCRIEDFAGYAIFANDSNLTISNNRILHNFNGIKIEAREDPSRNFNVTIENNLIDNRQHSSAGIFLNRGRGGARHFGRNGGVFNINNNSFLDINNNSNNIAPLTGIYMNLNFPPVNPDDPSQDILIGERNCHINWASVWVPTEDGSIATISWRHGGPEWSGNTPANANNDVEDILRQLVRGCAYEEGTIFTPYPGF